LLDVGERVATRVSHAKISSFPKVDVQIDEYLQTGVILESQEILASSRFQALRLFSSIFTIGHTTAKTLYDQYNCRTLEDVRLHYEMITEESPAVRQKDLMRRRLNGGMKQVEIVDAWIALKEELDTPYVR
jgi:DNA polymerase mu